MKRILVIGNAGSGKTTFAQALAQKLNLPLIHLDQLFWLTDWEQREQAEFDQLLLNELKKEAWVMDGNYARTLPFRIEYADTVIFLDFNRWICTWRVIKRWIYPQEDQALGCPQKLDLPFLKYVFWDYPEKNRRKSLGMQKESKTSVNWIVFRQPEELRTWISVAYKP